MTNCPTCGMPYVYIGDVPQGTTGYICQCATAKPIQLDSHSLELENQKLKKELEQVKAEALKQRDWADRFQKEKDDIFELWEKEREKLEQVKIENEELRVFIEGCSEIHDYKTIMKDAIVVRGNIWECMKKQTSEASLFFSWLVEIAHHKPEHWRFKSAIKAFLDYKEKRGE